MFTYLYNKFFSIPSFFAKSCIGLDISDESFRFMELISTKDGIKLGRYGERQIPFGIIKSGEIKEKKELEKILSIFKKEEKIKSVRVCLSKTNSIPLWLIEKYLLVFEKSKISVLSLEPESQATTRAILKKDDLGTYMIVDIGKKFTSIYIVSRGVVMFSSLFPLGGNMFTKIIEKKLKTSFKEAEDIKIKYGLDKRFFKKEVFLMLIDGLSVLQEEISRRLLYWQTHKNENNKNRFKVEKIILCGGGANLIGLSDYFSVKTKIGVELANIWIHITDDKKNVPKISFEKSLSFVQATGLALENFNLNH